MYVTMNNYEWVMLVMHKSLKKLIIVDFYKPGYFTSIIVYTCVCKTKAIMEDSYLLLSLH